MTFAFASWTIGLTLIYTSLKNMTFADLLLGRPGPGQPMDIQDKYPGYGLTSLAGKEKGIGPGNPGLFGSVTGKVSGVSGSYEKFSRLVAAGTGLSVKVVAAWCLAEGGPDDNPLNIGPGNHYGSVEGAAKATIKLIRTSDYYRGIRASAGKSDKAQIDAIVASPWCPNCAGYKELLLGTYKRVS